MFSSVCLRSIVLAMMCVSSACCFHNSSDLEQQNTPFWDDVLHVCPDQGTEFDFLAVNAKRWVFSDPLCSKRNLCRVGEADNPGPLRVGSFNPHQLFNKEEVIAEWGDGIWGGAETSHTVDAMRVSSARFRTAG